MTGFSVEQIENMDRAGLIGLWKKLLPETLPRRASLSFLRYVLAYETQSKDSGGLPAGFKKRLQKQVAGRRSNRPNRSKRSNYLCPKQPPSGGCFGKTTPAGVCFSKTPPLS